MNRFDLAGGPTGRTHRFARAAAALVAVALGAGSALGVVGSAEAAVPQHAPVAAASAATTAVADEAQFLSLLNAHRVANHVAPLTVSSDLVAIARSWSATMAAGNVLAHNPNLATQVQNWEVVGENVGDGTDVVTLDNAFWASPGHRANELYAAFSQVGIGVVIDSQNTVWVTLDFRQPLNPPAAAPAPTHKQTPAQKAAAQKAAAKKAAAAKAAAAKKAAAKKAAAKKAAAKKAAAKKRRTPVGHGLVHLDQIVTAG